MFKSVLIAMLALAGVMTQAADTKARIDVDGMKQVKVAPGKKPAGGVCDNAGWIKDENQKKCTIFSESAPLKTDEWVVYEVSFTPDKDGKVVMNLRGTFFKAKDAKTNEPIWVCFDDIEVIGADIVNGDFEKAGANGKPEGWGLSDKKQYVDKDGKKYVKVWHNQPASQTLAVKAGQEVTVKAKVKKGE